jgi:isocitrate dehydrogenase
MLYTYKRTEDDYWNDRADALERAERDAMESAEMAADLQEFDSEDERDAYIEEYFDSEYQRLCREYEKNL